MTLTYRGKPGCRNIMCTQAPPGHPARGDDDRCYGWHCSTCDESVSYQGHDCPERARADTASTEQR